MESKAIVPDSCRGFEFVGHSSLDGRGHSDQVMVTRGFAYVGHSKTRGVSVVNVNPGDWKIIDYL